jgi:Zn-dependent protease with chaperone function
MNDECKQTYKFLVIQEDISMKRQCYSPIKFKGLPWLLALSATASTFVSAPNAQASLFSISEKEEIQAGEQVRQQAYKEYGQPLPASNPMAQRVRAIGQRFAKLSTRKNIPYSYEVLANDKILNAFAAPGGPVFVTRKLVQTTSNDAELAYVLGHETGHIEQKHIVKAVEKQQKVGLGVGILGAVLGGGRSGNIFGAIGNAAFTVWSRGYSRDQESEADAVGVRWMSRLGFDPRAAVSMLGKLGSGSGGPQFLSTHPDPKNRQQAVSAQIQKENLISVATQAGGPRLTAADLPDYDYRNTSVTSNDGNAYPDDYRVPDGNTGDSSSARLAGFDAPLLRVTSGNYVVIMAPVGGFARWARADVDTDNNDSNIVRLDRGNNFIRLRRNSRVATINGQSVTMPAPAAVYNNLLYAPLGNLAEGVGGSATLSDDNRTIWLTLDGQRWYMNLR